jgi:cytoskeletal protein RodZ
MPLDTGRISDLDYRPGDEAGASPVESFRPTVHSGPSIGAALKAVREAQGLSLEDVAETTCVRRAYLGAIEDMRLDQLPSRPFVVGYVRAYAAALGIDSNAAVERFKADKPAPDQALREPVGVGEDRDPRLALAGLAGTAIIAAILVWNVAQHVLTEPAAKHPAAAAPTVIDRSVTAKAGPVALGAPLPPPVESTTPPPYVTPGLEAAAAAGGSADAAEDAAKLAKAQPPAPPPPDLPAVFVSKGAVFGASAENSVVTLQARKPASIIIRGADGSVYFARQLAAGEAYRAPNLKGLTLDVSEPESFQVFVAGQTRGLLPAAQMPISKLEG